MTTVASDLDQTLIYSKRSRGEYPGPLILVESIGPDPISYVSERGRGLFDELVAASRFVAVTTRDVDQVERVALPFETVLCANGGVLVHQGERVLEHDRWASRQAGSAAPLQDAVALVPEGDWVRSHRIVAGLFVCVVAESFELLDQEWVASASAWASANGWVFSQQGRKAYLVPAGLDKGSALLHARDLLGWDDHLITAGDSILDVPLLAVGDEAVRPGHGELVRFSHLVPAHVEVLPETGLLAGDRILGWFLERC